MFRVVDHMPSVYLENSRDFQLFARLMDVMFIGKNFDINKMTSYYDPLMCPEKWLPYLAEAIGFVPRRKISTDDMRIVLKAFPYLLKWKGSKKAIRIAVNIGLMLQGLNAFVTDENIIISGTNVELQFDQAVDTTVIEEIFRYIAPNGYTMTATEGEFQFKYTEVVNANKLQLAMASTRYVSKITEVDNAKPESWVRETITYPSGATNDFSVAEVLEDFTVPDQETIPAGSAYTDALDGRWQIDANTYVYVSYVQENGTWHRKAVKLYIPPNDDPIIGAIGIIQIVPDANGDLTENTSTPTDETYEVIDDFGDV
jgi:hypothetical protein